MSLNISRIPDPFKKIIESKGNSDGPCHFHYVVSDNNEKTKVIKTLEKQPVAGEVLLGVTWFYPLNILAHRGIKATEHKAKKPLTERKIEWVLLLGTEPNRKIFWSDLNKIVIETESHIYAKEKIIKLMRSLKKKIFTDKAGRGTPESILKHQLKILQEECEDKISWLSSDKKYSLVRNYFLENRVKVKTLDLYNPICMKSVAAALKNLQLDTIYLSDIPEIAFNFDKTDKLRSNIIKLQPYTTDNTLLVDTRAYSIKEFDINKPIPTVAVLRVRKKMKSAKPTEIIQDYPGFKNFCKSLIKSIKAANKG